MKFNIELLGKRLSCLIIPLLFIFLSLNGSFFAQSKVVGYFTHYRRNIYPADSLQINNLTHVIHDCAWANADGSIYTPNGFLYPALNSKVHNAGKKILLCFGSDGISNFANFGTVISNSSLRATFVNNITNYLIANNYDGADFDWESPTCASDEANFLAFITALRASFNSRGSQLLITLAVTVDSYYGQWFNYESLTPLVDWYNMMGYDIHGSWISHTGHNAPIYPGTDTHGCSSEDGGVTYLSVTRSIPKSKIVLGVPFYGYEYTGATGSGYLSTYSSVSQLSYAEILTEASSGGFVYHWDNGSQVPYYMNSSSGKFISFDDTNSIRAKANYSVAQGLGGVMIWELDNDLVSGHQPLLETLGQSLLGNTPPPVIHLPAQVILLSPANAASNQPVQLTLTWHKAAYASNYTVQVATDVNFINIIGNFTSITDTTKSITSLANNTKYYWRVQGVNQNGSGSQSGTNSFTTVAGISVPGKPTPLAPVNGAVNQATSLQLKWTKVSGGTSYLVQLSRSSTFSSLDLADSSLTDSVRQISSLLNNTIYYWRVRGKNTGGIGSWSTPYTFTTLAAISVPGQPTPLSPLNNALNQATSLQLKWTKVSGATSYLVQLSRSNTFNTIDLADSSLTDSVRQISSLLNNTIYYWRVRAKNTAGIGTWSTAYTFTSVALVTNNQPPVPICPANGQRNLSSQITFKWGKTNNSVNYNLEVAKDNLFNQIVINDSQITDTTRSETIKNRYTKFYWRVASVNSAGVSTWSNTWSFTTSQSAPYKLTAALAQTSEILLTWQDTTVATLSEYMIERNSSLDTNFVVIDSVSSTQTSYIDKSVTAGITYDYRIKGVSNLVESDYSNEVSIITTITAVKNISMNNTYELMQNYPNPFNPSTAITYQLAALGKVQIKIFDMLGREVKTLVNNERPAGKYQVVWNATDNSGNKVPSGIYICSLRTNSYSQSRKMILMK